MAAALRARLAGAQPARQLASPLGVTLVVDMIAIGLLPSVVVAVLPSNIDVERRRPSAREAIAGRGG